MTDDKVEVVRRLLEATNPDRRRRRSRSCSRTRARSSSSGPASRRSATYRGHEGARRYFADIADAFREWRNEPGQIVGIGPDTVLVENTFRGIGKESGMPVELRSAMVVVLSAEKAVRALAYPTREEALEAAGLEP